MEIFLGLNTASQGLPYRDTDPSLRLDLNFLHGAGGSMATSVIRGVAPVFTRASVGAYFDQDGVLQSVAVDAPRFNHDPASGVALGLLIKEQRENLATYSEVFRAAISDWVNIECTITDNAAVAPDGATTMDKIVESGNSANHLIRQTYAGFTDTQDYINSVFAKAGERSWLRVEHGSAAFPAASFVFFNLSNGTVGAVGGGIAAGDYGIIDEGGGIYKCWVKQTADATASSSINFYLASADNTFSYAGDGSSGLYLWGAQLEAASFPSSYIATTTAAVTRSADVASIALAGLPGFSTTVGTLLIEWRAANIPSASDFARVVQIDDGSENNRITTTYRHTTGEVRCDIVGGVAGGFVSTGNYTDGSAQRVAIGWAEDDLAISRNGSAVVTDTDVDIPTGLTTLNIGADASGGNIINGHIARLVYWNRRLPDADLVGLTT